MAKPKASSKTGESVLMHRLYALYKQRGGLADPETLAARLRRMELGLTAEGEFAELLKWLGRCQVAHKMDQAPSIGTKYQVPDLMAVFRYKRRLVSVLVEVKSTKSKRLSWKPDYLRRLQRYGEHVGHPVLLAWKHRPSGFWLLCELRHFARARQNYNLRFNDAMINTLMSILAGDFSFTLEGGLAWHLKLRKEEPGVNVATLPAGKGFRAVIEDSYLALKDGRRVTNVKGLLWLLMSVDQEVVVDEDATHVHQSFVIPDGGPSQFAHRVLPPLLEVLDKPVPLASQLRAAVTAGFAAGAVKHGFTIQPASMPRFLHSGPKRRNSDAASASRGFELVWPTQ